MKELLNKRKERGITLLALVITVIVLVILSAVSINLLLGNQGIITRAKEAKQQYRIEAAKEKITLAIADYEANMRDTKLSEILHENGIEVVESEKFPYIVIVDEMMFSITEDLQVEYIGKADKNVPEIIETHTENIEENTKAKITVKAKTKSNLGIEKIELLLDGTKVQEKSLSEKGKEIEDEFTVNSNGTYKVNVIGANKRSETSEDIVVSGLQPISGSLKAGTVIEGKVLLTIKGSTTEGTIEKVTITRQGGGTTGKVEYKYDQEEKTEIDKQYDVELPFYDEQTYIAIIENSNGDSLETNSERVTNTNSIRTTNDLNKLLTLVNNGTDNFAEKTIKQVASITSSNHTAIGTTEHPFKGIYNGQGNTLNVTVSSTNDCQGAFGYIEGATIQNITLDGGSITGATKVGGAVGYAKNSTIDSIINKANSTSTRVSSTSTYTETGEYVPEKSYGKSSGTWTLTNVCSVGGICGKAEDTTINNCQMQGYITKNTDGIFIGGIVGYAKGNNTNVTNCKNSGVINSKDGKMGGIIGFSQGNVSIQNCINTNSITSSGGFVGGVVGQNEGGNIDYCTNSGTVEAKYSVGGIVGKNGNTSEVDYASVNECSNTGNIISTGSITSTCTSNGSEVQYDAAWTGGIVGFAVKTNITSCSNNNTVNSTSSSKIFRIGGIAGEIRDGTITMCYNSKNGVIGTTNKYGGVGGIVGTGFWNVNINNCYNVGNIMGNSNVGGISSTCDGNIRYCYNSGNVAAEDAVGGISAQSLTFTKNSYGNNFIYYCYNRGTVTGTGSKVGSICGNLTRADVDYTYSLTGTSSKLWGSVNDYKNRTYQGFQDKATLTNTVLSFPENKFKNDYTGDESVNEGFPILSWQ